MNIKKAIFSKFSKYPGKVTNVDNSNFPSEIGGYDFSEFTYSRKNHFKLFGNLDIELYKEKKNLSDCDLKIYQDLLVLAFFKENVAKNSRILEIGGGESRIFNHVKNEYECWNLDKLEGVGNGPIKIEMGRIRLVKDYIGDFNHEVPDEYFDFVFSISALEHVPQDDRTLFKKILDDINRVLKPGGFSLHCFDSILKANNIWTHPLLPFIFKNQVTLNSFIDLVEVRNDPDIYFMSKSAYNRLWERIIGEKYENFGKPFSYNVLWQKQI